MRKFSWSVLLYAVLALAPTAGCPGKPEPRPEPKTNEPASNSSKTSSQLITPKEPAASEDKRPAASILAEIGDCAAQLDQVANAYLLAVDHLEDEPAKGESLTRFLVRACSDEDAHTKLVSTCKGLGIHPAAERLLISTGGAVSMESEGLEHDSFEGGGSASTIEIVFRAQSCEAVASKKLRLMIGR